MAAARPRDDFACPRTSVFVLGNVSALCANTCGVLNTAIATANGQEDQKQETLTTIDLKRKREIYFSQNYNQWQKSWNVLFFPTRLYW